MGDLSNAQIVVVTVVEPRQSAGPLVLGSESVLFWGLLGLLLVASLAVVVRMWGKSVREDWIPPAIPTESLSSQWKSSVLDLVRLY